MSAGSGPPPGHVAPGSPPSAARGPLSAFIPPDEPVLLVTRPGFLFVFVYRQGWWLWPPALMIAVHLVLRRLVEPDPLPRLPLLAVGWIILGFLWRVLAWWLRHYVLTERRAMVVAGVVSRVAGDVPLRNVQHATVTQSVLERIFGLGTVGIATAGSNGAAINWLMVPRPQDVLDAVRRAADAARIAATPHRNAARAPVVIGLAGGIGAGKSEVAKILGRLGAVVIDSDREAKAALDRPEIREQLVSWWGERILEPDGRVSRRAVADIIFNDPEQRRRLESVVHPVVRMRRAEARRLADQRGAAAVVIDAPLLFEAGLDRECDRIIFVDAPRELRLERVRATRGWDEQELARREASQHPSEEKRRRATHVIVNDGSPEALARAVEAVFGAIVRGR